MDLSKFIKKYVKVFLQQYKKIVPVRTGNLKRSSLTEAGKSTGIYKGLFYWFFIELGTKYIKAGYYLERANKATIDKTSAELEKHIELELVKYFTKDKRYKRVK